MEMVKLKMRTIYKTFLSFIVFLLLVVIALGVSYLFYDKILENDSDIEVTGPLSINYIDGKKIQVIDYDTLSFSITNSSSKTEYYNIGFLQVRGNGDYKIKNNEVVIAEGKLKSIDEITTEYFEIKKGETKIFTLEINNSNNDILTAILNIRDKERNIITFADTILKNTPASENSLTKVGEESAIEDEGLIKNYDDISTSYYFRGNTQNNYVYFADFMWRIVRINGDGTIRLVLDGVTDSLTTYYSTTNPNYSYVNSELEKHLKDWYDLYISDYSEYIANTKFCSDITHDDNYNYNAYVRIMTNKIPTLNCLGNNVTSNIGTLTIDEVILAGASPSHQNINYYLYNENIKDLWYTLSGAKGNSTSINLFMVDANGNIKTDVNGNLYRQARPVINLIKNIEVTGNGTKDQPYMIGDLNDGVTR